MIDAIKRLFSRKRFPTFEARQGLSRAWHVVEFAGGRIVNTSENYATKANAVRSAKRQAKMIEGATWRVRE